MTSSPGRSILSAASATAAAVLRPMGSPISRSATKGGANEKRLETYDRQHEPQRREPKVEPRGLPQHKPAGDAQCAGGCRWFGQRPKLDQVRGVNHKRRCLHKQQHPRAEGKYLGP